MLCPVDRPFNNQLAIPQVIGLTWCIGVTVGSAGGQTTTKPKSSSGMRDWSHQFDLTQPMDECLSQNNLLVRACYSPRDGCAAALPAALGTPIENVPFQRM